MVQTTATSVTHDTRSTFGTSKRCCQAVLPLDGIHHHFLISGGTCKTLASICWWHYEPCCFVYLSSSPADMYSRELKISWLETIRATPFGNSDLISVKHIQTNSGSVEERVVQSAMGLLHLSQPRAWTFLLGSESDSRWSCVSWPDWWVWCFEKTGLGGHE